MIIPKLYIYKIKKYVHVRVKLQFLCINLCLILIVDQVLIPQKCESFIKKNIQVSAFNVFVFLQGQFFLWGHNMYLNKNIDFSKIFGSADSPTYWLRSQPLVLLTVFVIWSPLQFTEISSTKIFKSFHMNKKSKHHHLYRDRSKQKLFFFGAKNGNSY